MTTNTSPWVVVDDADPAIIYNTEAQWAGLSGSVPGTVSLENAISNTSHVLSSNGSFSFEFTGTQIEVFGVSSKLNLTENMASPNWTCSIDNIVIPSNLTAVRGIPWSSYCSQFGLDNRSHVLTVNVTASQQTQFWLDYLRYTPTSQTLTQNQTILYNSTDAALQYTGGSLWASVGSAMVTNIAPTDTGPGAIPPSMTFKFNGTGLTWYSVTIQSLMFLNNQNPGAFPSNNGVAMFTMDDNAPRNITIPKAKAVDSAFDQILAKFDTLDPAVEHTLTVTYPFQFGQGGQPKAPLSLDFLLVETGSSMDAVSPSGSNNQPTTTPGSPNTGTTAPHQTLSAKSSSVNTGAIVGGVLGGILFIIILFLLLRYRALRQRSARRKQPHPAKNLAFIPDTFSDHHHENDSYPMRSPDSHVFEPIVAPTPTRDMGSKFVEDKSIEMESEPEPSPPRRDHIPVSNVDNSRQTMYSSNSVRQSTLIDFSEQQPTFNSQTPSINTVTTNPFRRMNMASNPSPDMASLSSSTRSPSNPFRGGPLNPSAYR